jgi:hypothetical protein
VEFEEARSRVLRRLEEKGHAAYAEILVICENDQALCDWVCQELRLTDLAEDKKGAGLIYTGASARDAPALAAPAPTQTPDATGLASTVPDAELVISYAHLDIDRAREIVRHLENADVNLWWDRGRRKGIKVGEWPPQITRAIRVCKALAVLCSSNSIQRPEVRKEIQIATTLSRTRLPLHLDETYLDETNYPDDVLDCMHRLQRVEIIDRPPAEWLPKVFDALEDLGVAFNPSYRPVPMLPATAAPTVAALALTPPEPSGLPPAADALPRPGQRFRIYVSSTLADLKAERDALQKYVFPRLRELCSRRGARFEAVDMRWGISEEAALDHQTMPILRTEIERCQRTTPRPNFMAILGDRYGWRPLPAQIPAHEFEMIRGRVSAAGQALLDEWYLRDENAVPAEYHLKPRDPYGEFADYGAWAPVERAMHSILLEGIKGTPLEGDTRYGASATEQEIEDGLRPADAEEHVPCFFRSILTESGLPVSEDLPPSGAARVFVDLGPDKALDAEAHTRLEALKQRLRERLGSKVHECEATWTGDGITTDHIGELPEALDECLAILDDPTAPSTLCVDVWKELASMIQLQLAQTGEVASEEEIHHQFARERAADFVGRQEILGDIALHLTGDQANLCVVVGAPGSGKSALLAKAAEEARSAGGGAVVQERYIGASPGSSDIRSLLSELCRAISDSYGDATPVPTEYRELASELPKRLALATAERPLALFVDGLDRLSESEGARSLGWLPGSLPEHARIVVSTRHELLDHLQAKHPTPLLLPVDRNSREECAELLDRWLARANRTLPPGQRENVLDAVDRAGGMPLYLELAFEEARLWKSDTTPPPLGESIEGIIRANLLPRQREHHGALLVERSMAYLAASRHGLAEDELLALLSRDEELYQEVKEERAGQELPEAEIDRRLPIVLWSRLFFDLAPYLSERHFDGALLIGFYHRELGAVAADEYLKEGVAEERHGALADYFRSRVDPALDGTWTGADTRGLTELPYHLAEAERFDELVDVLTDFRFLERKVAEVGVVERIEREGTASRIYNGVDLLADDFGHALARMPGGEPRGRRRLIVTAVDFRDGEGLRVGCPWCDTRHPFEETWRGMEIECPNCSGPLRVSPFVAGESPVGGRP